MNQARITFRHICLCSLFVANNVWLLQVTIPTFDDVARFMSWRMEEVDSSASLAFVRRWRRAGDEPAPAGCVDARSCQLPCAWCLWKCFLGAADHISQYALNRNDCVVLKYLYEHGKALKGRSFFEVGELARELGVLEDLVEYVERAFEDDE